MEKRRAGSIAKRTSTALVAVALVAVVLAAPVADASDKDHGDPDAHVDMVTYAAGSDATRDVLGDQGPAVECRPGGDASVLDLRVPECVGGARYVLPVDDCDGHHCEAGGEPGTFAVFVNDVAHTSVSGTVYVLDGAGLVVHEESFCRSTEPVETPADAAEIVVALDVPGEALPPGCAFATTGVVALSITA